MFIGAGQQQQVVDQGLHPLGLGQHGLIHQFRPEQLRMGQPDLQGRDDRAQRAAQFVGGVPDESALGGVTELDAGEHVVHRHRQRGYLISVGRHRNALGEVMGADVGDAQTDGLYRAQRAAHQNEGRDSRTGHHQRHRDHQQHRDNGDCRAHAGAVRADQYGVPVALTVSGRPTDSQICAVLALGTHRGTSTAE